MTPCLSFRFGSVAADLKASGRWMSRSERVGVAPSVRSQLISVKHRVPMMSLDNCFTPDDVKAWLGRLHRLLERDEQDQLDFLAEVKIDGVSLSLRYEDGMLTQGATRGNGVVGEDVTANVKMVPDIPHQLQGRIARAASRLVRPILSLPLQTTDCWV